MLVLDANILIRAVLGSKVLLLLQKYAGCVKFVAPDVAFTEAREHLPVILAGAQNRHCSCYGHARSDLTIGSDGRRGDIFAL